MSRWRQKGFVLDSDDEDEESQIESQHLGQNARNRRVERVNDDRNDNGEGPVDKEQEQGIRCISPTPILLNDLTSSTNTPHELRHGRIPSNSWSQNLSSPSTQGAQLPLPSQSQTSSIALAPSPTIHTHRGGDINPFSSQILGNSTITALPNADLSKTTANTSTILREFGIVPLSDDSENDSLSDPPTDLESPPPAFITPHRRTAVQVLIPSSVALQQHISQQRQSREFRQRKPIQIHPYALESELYKREVQSRGLKPVPREISPQHQARQQESETQENEFDPNRTPSSSPPEMEIHVATPSFTPARKGLSKHGSSRHHELHSMSETPSTQLHLPKTAKPKSFEVSSTQIPINSTRAAANRIRRRDLRSILPNSPPQSSSPKVRGAKLRRPLEESNVFDAGPNLPTPSTSSVFHDDPQIVVDSDSDPITHSVQKAMGGLRRPTRIVLSDSSSEASESSSDTEKSDQELKKVGRKIKGVLPASWLRFDRLAQERRKAHQLGRGRVRSNIGVLPDSSEVQRGVAKRVSKRSSWSRKESASVLQILSVSGVSEDEIGEPSLPLNHNQQESVQDALRVAAMLDNRYPDDDLSDMENDRLHLPTLAGNGSKRKRQSKLTEAFANTKRARVSSSITSRGGTGKPSHGHNTSKRKCVKSRRVLQSTLPAMSIVDLDLSPIKSDGTIPQFLRVARRQALRRPDLGRQSPHIKQIRLHSARDTMDANLVLQQWYQGSLKPRTRAISERYDTRAPLKDKIDNQQQSQTLYNTEVVPTNGMEEDTVAEIRSTRSQQPLRKELPPGLHIFKRTSYKMNKSPQQRKNDSSAVRRPKQPIRRTSLPFRTAQLEDDEKEFSRGHKNIAFEKNLHGYDQQFGTRLSRDVSNRNPVLARFLADENTQLPPLPSAKDVGEYPMDRQGEILPKHIPAPRKRLIRKARAKRVDIDAREYRQPSEPAVEEVLNTESIHTTSHAPEQNGLSLQGLGPYGTRYPITFDVHPLVSETYFHVSTFIGSSEFQRALCTGAMGGRDLDEPAGYCALVHDTLSFRCGPWSDETFSRIQSIMQAIWVPVDDQAQDIADFLTVYNEVSVPLAKFTRLLIFYVSTHLSFVDPIDRRDFVSKMLQLVRTLFDRLDAACNAIATEGHISNTLRNSIRAMSYLLVLGVQVRQISQLQNLDISCRDETVNTLRSIATTVVTLMARHGVSELNDFLERNKRHAIRVNGVQDDEILAESVVICMHTLSRLAVSGLQFWDIISQSLSMSAAGATHIHPFEVMWATLYTFLPFIEIDMLGLPIKDGRHDFQSDNWSCIGAFLKRLFELYPSTSRRNASSLNDFVRANLARCHRLIHQWHWRRPEHMLRAVFDFYGKNGLRQLRHEASSGSAPFLDNLATEHELALAANDSSFHIALKCLALGLQGMTQSYVEKRIRSFVFRTIPNHGRAYPKDQPLDEESLAALRNHHDLLSTLYWAAPPLCRPKLEHIRDLVNHESSHREACRVNVRAWANLTTFQVSTDEPYESTKPFALWHRDIIHQTLKQYRVAKTEADDYLKSGALNNTADVSVVLVRQMMEKNQEQVIAILRDCIAGMKKAIQQARDQVALRALVFDSDVVHLLELPHLEDRRLVTVTRDTLLLLREYTSLQNTLSSKETIQQCSEESQEYGTFPDLDDLESLDGQHRNQNVQQATHDFIQAPLWHLLSNAFGAETSPDEQLLTDCIDTWIRVAEGQVASGERSWSYYIDSFSQVSWQQLRRTEQTRKFAPYFLASLIDRNPAAYDEHSQELMAALLTCLVDRDSMLRFQYRLLHSIVRTNLGHTLLKNIPFFRNQQNGEWDITNETLRSRRIALLSSILSNMRDELQTISVTNPACTAEVRRMYATLLKDFMTAMKSNYQQLQQGATVTGAYVEFVQQIVQFLKQYTNDICPVLPFFTDSVAFPLPAADPTYVVGRLCGYAPKVNDLGTAKQLSVFIQTVAQQAAADNQQAYLVNQLIRALCTNEAPCADRLALRSVLLQGIFPAYLEEAFSSSTAFVIARPILHALPSILETMIFDLRVTQRSSLASIVTSTVSISHAFIRGTEHLKEDTMLFQRPHILSALSYMLEAMISNLPLVAYIWSRTMSPMSTGKPSFIVSLEKISIYIAAMIHGMVPHEIPSFDADAYAASVSKLHHDLLTFCREGLVENIKANWAENNENVWFGQGQARREVMFDIGTTEQEKARLIAVIEAFHGALSGIYEDERDNTERTTSFGPYIVV